jgi:hypothetical protein
MQDLLIVRVYQALVIHACACMQMHHQAAYFVSRLLTYTCAICSVPHACHLALNAVNAVMTALINVHTYVVPTLERQPALLRLTSLRMPACSGCMRTGNLLPATFIPGI